MEVEIVPSGRKARVRGLQTHQESLGETLPGTRVAVNLSGIDHTDIARGDVLTTPRWLQPVTVFDAVLRVIPSAPRPIRHNHQLIAYSGTRETAATVRLLEGDALKPGDSGWAQVRLLEPAPLVKGDFFVLRDTQDTLGGGRVLELNAPRHRRNDPRTIQRLETLAGGSEADVVLEASDKSGPVAASALARMLNMPEEQIAETTMQLVNEGLAVRISAEPPLFISSEAWSRLRSEASDALASFHRQYPLRRGMPREELRNRLKLKATVFTPVLQALEREGVAIAEKASVHIPEHRPELSPEQERVAAGYLDLLGSSRYSPPADSSIDPELLSALIERGDVVRAGDDVIFLANAYREMTERVIEHARNGGDITIDAVRQLFSTSRKYTLALLEQMDRDNVTRREGDVRMLK
jgi:selenocysteine-specific elongation factor